ncbi:MAG TPA: XrtA system polysaccharide deacetylase [Dongiaceae bacterium]|nr:XrtA system polysaccharide deacetylase [Dongiaceae bacterium]
MLNALTIDLEDYYQVSAFNDSVDYGTWQTRESRVERNTDKLLQFLHETGQSATFFTLGWIAEHYPNLIRKVADQGHEIACHSLRHRTVYKMTRSEFREDTLTAKKLLEDCSGTPVRGYRAPSFSITNDSLWALEILAELGFAFDSSIFPVKHAHYGIISSPRSPYRVDTPSGPLVEFPMTTLEFIGLRSPIAGGAYFRILPYWYTRWAINFLNHKENRPVCVYLHPWEIDPEQPRMDGKMSARLRHYIGLGSAPRKFQRLLRDFRFCNLGLLASRYSDAAPS